MCLSVMFSRLHLWCCNCLLSLIFPKSVYFLHLMSLNVKKHSFVMRIRLIQRFELWDAWVDAVAQRETVPGEVRETGACWCYTNNRKSLCLSCCFASIINTVSSCDTQLTDTITWLGNYWAYGYDTDIFRFSVTFTSRLLILLGSLLVCSW